MKHASTLITLIACLLLSTSLASAHAVLEHAEPAVGSEVAKAPAEIKLWFSQDLEPAFSKVQVFDQSAKEIDKKEAHLDPKNHKLMIIAVPALPAGTYKVVWKVVSIDTHRTTGTFKFTVK